MLIDSLNKGTDFKRVRRFGKREKYKFVTLSILSTQNDRFRLGFQISKKLGMPYEEIEFVDKLDTCFMKYLKK